MQVGVRPFSLHDHAGGAEIIIRRRLLLFARKTEVSSCLSISCTWGTYFLATNHGIPLLEIHVNLTSLVPQFPSQLTRMVKALQMTLTALGGLARPWWLASLQIRLRCGNLKHNTRMECRNQHLARAEFRVGVNRFEP